jgi:hypothetical protein
MGSYSSQYLSDRRLRNPDGTFKVHCRKCGRHISNSFRPFSIAECLICQGYPEENVLQQYVLFDPTRPPVPVNSDQDTFDLYPEEEKPVDPRLGVIGTAKAFFRALGIARKKEKIQSPSTKVAKSKRQKGLFER